MVDIVGPVRLMRSRNSGDTPSALLPGQVHIDEFTGQLSHGDASTTPNAAGAYTTLVRYNLKALVAALTAVRSVTTGGTGSSVAGGAAVDNISGFSGTGFLLRTAAATYGFVAQAALALSSRQVTGTGALTGGGDLTADRTLDVAANGVTNAKLAQMAAGTVKANTGGALANAADVTLAALKTALAIVVGDVSGLGTAATRNVGTTSGTVAAGDDARFSASATFVVTSKIAKSAAFTASDANGTLYDLSGSFAATLPAASGGSASAPIWRHFRKRDGSGACTLALTGSDAWEDGTTAPKFLYQEFCTVYSLGGGVWAFAPGTRQRGWVDCGSFSVTNTASITTTAGAGDAEAWDLEIDFTNLVPSAAAYFKVTSTQGTSTASVFSGCYVTQAGSSGGGGQASSVNIGATTTSSNARAGVLLFKNIQSGAASGIFVETATCHATWSDDYLVVATTAGALQSITVTPSTGTISTINYDVRIFRR